MVVGDSSTGKTRLLYQLLREQVGDWPVLAPDLAAGAGLVNALAEATVKLPKTGLVVWLDELPRFLPGPYLSTGADGLSAGTLRKLLDAPTPVVLVGALWPEHMRELRAEDTTRDDLTMAIDRIKQLVAENNKLQEENDTLARIINVLEVENHGLRAGIGRTGQLVALPSANHADFVHTGHLKLLHQLKHNTVFTLLAPDPACLSRHHDESAAP